MDLTLSVLLLSWSWRPEIMLTLGSATALHLVGRWRLKQRGGSRTVPAWRSVAYLGGLAVLWVALMSPIDVMSGQFFYMHMVQHLLLVMIAPPLLWIGNPMPVAMWGMPPALRLEVGRWLRPDAEFRRVVRSLTTPGLAWIYFVAALVGWHEPVAYNAALQHELVHDLEHLTFYGTAMLLWWHIIGAAPHIHKRMPVGVRIAYALSVVPVNMLTGVAIAFASEPLYNYYSGVPRLGRLTLLEDQMLGGVIMWIPGSMMYLIAALILVAGLVRSGGDESQVAATQ
ncbi:cytochrome c oxidase assembly protein [Chloroflexota bacterium]